MPHYSMQPSVAINYVTNYSSIECWYLARHGRVEADDKECFDVPPTGYELPGQDACTDLSGPLAKS